MGLGRKIIEVSAFLYLFMSFKDTVNSLHLPSHSPLPQEAVTTLRVPVRIKEMRLYSRCITRSHCYPVGYPLQEWLLRENLPGGVWP